MGNKEESLRVEKEIVISEVNPTSMYVEIFKKKFMRFCLFKAN